MYRLYSILFSLGLVLMAPYYIWRHRGRKELAGWRERLGRLPSSLQQERPGAIWIHAVSVGETLAVAGLIGQLHARYPERKIFLSSVTAAGREAGEKKLPGVAGRFYLPFDWKWAVQRVLRQIRPSVFVIVETELWPNLLKAVRESGCCTILVNARVSDRSFPGYRLGRPFMRRVLQDISRICTQTATDAERFQQLGAPPDRLIVTGNLKFDSRPPEFGKFGARIEEVLAAENRSPVFVAGSTMRGEEPLVLEAWQRIRARHPRAIMILVPRHPARFDEVAEMLQARQVSAVRRTNLPDDEDEIRGLLSSTEILLLDTIGELAEVLGVADVVFMGGSLVPTGGHNVVEPAFWGKPILFGPHMNNFRDVARLFLGADGAIQVADAKGLADAVLRLLDHPDDARQLGDRARGVVNQQAGAASRILKQMEEWLGTPQTTVAPSHPMNRSLMPLAGLYGAGARLRGRAFQHGWLKPRRLSRPVISVGNLTVGGSGKTPLVAVVAEILLRHGYTPAILTRGYGRERGADLIALEPGPERNPDARTIGDEPALLARALPQVPIIICADRFRAGQLAEQRFSVDVHILDDGFQHFAVEREVDLVAIDVTQDVLHGAVLPAGRLREPVSALARADVIVLTRTEINDPDSTEKQVKEINSAAPVFRCATELRGLVDAITRRQIEPGDFRGKPVCAFCGIGNPSAFFANLRRWGFNPVVEVTFRDHHVYTQEDISRILKAAIEKDAAAILTTEKDLMNLHPVMASMPSVMAFSIQAKISEADKFEQVLLAGIERKQLGSKVVPGRE
jgi:3-deoxy-D-manno-octulosonic-acid transferase